MSEEFKKARNLENMFYSIDEKVRVKKNDLLQMLVLGRREVELWVCTKELGKRFVVCVFVCVCFAGEEGKDT